MSIFITGARGFVGSNFTRFLDKTNNDYIKFDGDITEKKDFDKYLEKGIDAIVHIAAKTNIRDKDLMKRVNIDGTKNVLEFAQKKNVKKIIHLSTIKVLSKNSDPYINSKKEAEILIKQFGIPYIVLRPSMIYGPGDKKNIGFLMNVLKNAPVVPVFKFRLQPLYIDDLINIMNQSLGVEPNKEYNIAGKEEINFKEVLFVCKELGYKFRMINWPIFFNLLLKMVSILPFSPLPHWQVKSLLTDEVFESDDWENIFNIKLTNFKNGIKKTIGNNL